MEQFITSSGTEQISKYDFQLIKEVLEDQEIAASSQFPYLKYYHPYGLVAEQKQNLMKGFWFLNTYANVDIGQLSQKERELLWQPILGRQLLKSAGKTDDFWQRLAEKETFALMDYLSVQCSPHVSLEPRQFRQLTETPDMILPLLQVVLHEIEQGQRDSFLNIWLANEEYYYDLQKLAKIIADLPEERIVQITRQRAAYIGAIYGTELTGIELEYLGRSKERLVIYAITNRKKHFLSLIREHFSVFCSIGNYSLLFEPDFYEGYVNINTLNAKNLEECRELKKMLNEKKALMVWKEYTFEEVKLLSQQEKLYTVLYHHLQYKKSDERLRVLRELIKRK